MQPQRDFGLCPREIVRPRHVHRLRVEDEQPAADGGEYLAIGGARGWVIPRPRRERGFKYLTFLLRIEREELRFLLGRPRATTTPVAAAAEDQAALGFISEGDDALVRDEVAIVLNGLVLLRVPHAQRAAKLPVGGSLPM